MLLMALLGAAIVAGLIVIWHWGSLELKVPWETGRWPLSPKETLHRYVWYVTVGLTAGIVAGVVMLGAGGRLVMRLLAVTAGPDAQGVVTEADQIVGEITLGGTLGFIGFFGMAVGTALGFAFMLVRRWLPRGLWGGLTFGLVVLLIFATRADPLRPDNPDFEIVGPDLVSVLAFTAIILGYGMLLSAIVGRYSRFLPLLKRDWKTIAKYAPPYLAFGPAFLVLAVPVIGVGAAAVLAARTQGVDRILDAQRTLLVGRALILLAAAIAAPGFVLGVADILRS